MYYVLRTTKGVIITPADYPHLDEPLHFDIQSHGLRTTYFVLRTTYYVLRTTYYVVCSKYY